MNHDLIIDTILNNKGIICGGYAREWLLKNGPSDDGWKDIDVFCEEKNQEIIKKNINKIDPSLIIDFKINAKNLSISTKGYYSINLFCMKEKNKLDLRNDENCKNQIKKFYRAHADCIIEKANQKICLFCNEIIGRNFKLEERIKSFGWSIEILKYNF